MICGKCFHNRGVVLELQVIAHQPVSSLPKPERREHTRCPSSIATCTFCQAERHQGKTFDVVHRVWRMSRGRMVEEFVTRAYPQVLLEVPAAKAA